jgi:hypothetical protein
MIAVEMGQGQGRERMETWFRRAMQADGDNLRACTAKMLYLEPKWHGNPEEMLRFGRECLATQNWEGRLPIMLPHVHYTLATCYLDEERRAAYYRQPQVWADIQAALQPLLGKNPDAFYHRTDYANWAVHCGQYAEANKQFELLGDGYSRIIFSPEQYQAARDKIRANLN